MSLSGLTDAHRAYLLRHLRPLEHVDLRAGEVRNNTSIVFMGCSQPSRLAPERAPEAKAERRVGADAVQSAIGNVGNLIDGV